MYRQNLNGSGFDLPKSHELLDRLSEWLRRKNYFQEEATDKSSRTVRNYLKGDGHTRETYDDFLDGVWRAVFGSDSIPDAVTDTLGRFEPDELQAGMRRLAADWDQLVGHLETTAFHVEEPAHRLIPFLRLATLDGALRLGAYRTLAGLYPDEVGDDLPTWMEEDGFKKVMDQYRDAEHADLTLQELVDEGRTDEQGRRVPEPLVTMSALQNWRAGESLPREVNLDKLAEILAEHCEPDATAIATHLRCALAFGRLREHVAETCDEHRLEDFLAAFREATVWVHGYLSQSPPDDKLLREMVLGGGRARLGPAVCTTLAENSNNSLVADDFKALTGDMGSRIRFWFDKLGEFEAPDDQRVANLQQKFDPAVGDESSEEFYRAIVENSHELVLKMEGFSAAPSNTVPVDDLAPETDALRASRLSDEAEKHRRRGEFQPAREKLETVTTELAPKVGYYHYQFGTLLGQKAHSLYQQGRKSKARELGDRAIQECNLAAELDEDLGGVLTEIGIIQSNLSRHEEAEESFARAEEECPKAPEWDHHFMCRAWNLMELGEAEEALPVIERALELNPDNPLSRRRYIRCLLENDRLDDADEQFQQLRLATGVDPSLFDQMRRQYGPTDAR